MDHYRILSFVKKTLFTTSRQVKTLNFFTFNEPSFYKTNNDQLGMSADKSSHFKQYVYFLLQ